VSGTDCIIIYEYVLMSVDCPSKVNKTIKCLKAYSKEKAQKILQRKLAPSFVKERYVRHKILLEVQPFLERKASLLQDAEGFLRKHHENDSTKAKKGHCYWCKRLIYRYDTRVKEQRAKQSFRCLK